MLKLITRTPSLVLISPPLPNPDPWQRSTAVGTIIASEATDTSRATAAPTISAPTSTPATTPPHLRSPLMGTPPR